MSHLNASTASNLKNLFTGLRFALMMLLLCGAYSVLTTLLGQTLFPWQASGSLIEQPGRVIGSARIGQHFVDNGYFHGRPSAAAYAPVATSGSNLAPDNPALRRRVAGDAERISMLEGVAINQIPVDLLAASGSGLDPHISPAAARLQIPRIARIRRLDETTVAELVNGQIEGKQLGLLGSPRVNVLLLNLNLDQQFPHSHATGP